MNRTFSIPFSFSLLLVALSGCGDKITTCQRSRTCLDHLGEGGAGGEGGREAEGSTASDEGDGDGDGSGGPRDCSDETWDDDDDSETTCVPWTTCEPGTFVDEPGTATSDRSCSPCAEGTFSDAENAEACSEWSECPAGVEAAGSETADFECASPAVDVAVGNGFSCILREEGTVACWGKNDLGQLGSGRGATLSTPTAVVTQVGGEALDGLVQIDATGSAACALREDGSVWCWGSNASGQLGQPASLDSSRIARQVDGVSNAERVAVGENHACALLEDATLRCWSASPSSSILGAGNSNTKTVALPLDPSGSGVAFSGVTDVACGDYQTCAIDEAGHGYCWGMQNYGEVGVGDFGYSYYIPTQVSLGAKVEQVAAGWATTCWSHADGGLTCHGRGPFGPEVDPATQNYLPVSMPVPDDPETGDPLSVAELAVDGSVRCLLTEEGSVWCWGENYYGQLGNDTKEQSSVLVKVEGLSHIVAIDAGYSHACAVDEDGRVYCWGNNASGELGDGSVIEAVEPRLVPDVEGAVSLESGSDHTCAVLASGRLVCWGSNTEGQLGTGTSKTMDTPKELTAITEVQSFSAYGAQSLALKKDGTVRAWGGGLGGDRDEPGLFSALSEIRDVSVGGEHACAVDDVGRIYCWGENTYGQTGIDNGGEKITTPTVVGGYTEMRRIAAGDGHSCSIINGSVYCWGFNYYQQLGSKVGTSTPTLTRVSDLVQITALSLGFGYSLGLSTHGEVYSWGLNQLGQLGDGDPPMPEAVGSRVEAEFVVGVENATAITAGEAHACAVLEDGSAMCWGSNDRGQLGVGDAGEPVGQASSVVGLDDAIAISAGKAHTCAVHEDGRVSCWGSNESYQLGHARRSEALVPLEVVWE